MIEVGRICIKRKGRESGKYCIVLKKIDKNFVLITGPRQLTGVRRRKCNILHLEPTQYMLNIKEDSSDEEIANLFEKENLISKLGLKKLPGKKKS
jgi:large subunit ribosomal protein L14e